MIQSVKEFISDIDEIFLVEVAAVVLVVYMMAKLAGYV